MITFKRITASDKAYYDFVINLLVNSFPKEEYRDLDELEMFIEMKKDFYFNAILSDDQPVGLFSYWDLGNFYYAEHFAIDSTLRNGGYGKSSLEAICSVLHKPVILEVERPDTEMAQRRINFYERLGFKLWDNDYLQPPYRKGDEYLPLYLMSYGVIDADKEYEDVKDKIYTEVYQVKD